MHSPSPFDSRNALATVIQLRDSVTLNTRKMTRATITLVSDETQAPQVGDQT